MAEGLIEPTPEPPDVDTSPEPPNDPVKEPPAPDGGDAEEKP